VGGHYGYGLKRRGVFIDLTKTVQYARIQIGLRKKRDCLYTNFALNKD
jgi:hypothetical protein